MDVHRAARIAHIGHGGQILLSEITSALVRDELPANVTFQRLGRHRLKDIDRPEPIAQLLIDGILTNFPPLNSLEVLPTEVQLTKGKAKIPAFMGKRAGVDFPLFFGRERELSLLDEFLGRTLGGRGQVAFVVGEAGSGKTSLLNEFARRAQAAHSDLVVTGGICNAHIGVGDPYLPFRELLGMLTGDVEAKWAAGTITREQALRLWRLFPEVLEVLVDHGSNLVDTFVQGRALETRAAAFTAESLAGWNRLQELRARKRTRIEGQASD